MAAAKEPDWKNLHGWFQRAHTQSLAIGFHAVDVGSPEFQAWKRWFKSQLQWEPAFMRRHDGQVTLPSRWPPKDE